MNLSLYAVLCYIVLMLFLYIKFPMGFFCSIVLGLLFVGYKGVFGNRIPLDTNLWKGGAGDE